MRGPTAEQLQQLEAGLRERDEELKRLRAEVAAAKQAAAAQPDTHDYSEAETCDCFIDWVWDDACDPPRAVQGFYKKAELELAIQRRSTRKPLAAGEIDSAIVLTCRKGKYRPWRASVLRTVEATIDGRPVRYQLAERLVTALPGFRMREVRRLCDSGHQTAILTTRRDWPIEVVAYPRHNRALASLCETINALEIRYPGTDLPLVYEAPRVA